MLRKIFNMSLSCLVFKILMAFLGVAGLFIIFDLFPIILGKWKRQDVLVEGERESLTPFQVFFYSMLPLIGCLPGLVFFPETIPFFTLIEVSTFLNLSQYTIIVANVIAVSIL